MIKCNISHVINFYCLLLKIVYDQKEFNDPFNGFNRLEICNISFSFYLVILLVVNMKKEEKMEFQFLQARGAFSYSKI